MPTSAHEPTACKPAGKRDPWASEELPLIQQALAHWFAEHGRSAPWRETRDPYAILVSEIMLQQTRVETVLQGGWYQRWMSSFPDAQTLARASEESVLSHWQGLGYYNRARNLQRAAQAVCENHGGHWPTSAEALRQLPGIGDYTAAAVASLAFGEAVAAVDANVIRVLARVGNYAERIDRAPAKAWFATRAQEWMASIEPLHPGTHNAALMELGQQLCTARRPRCTVCPLQDWCQSTKPESLPTRPPKAKTIHLQEHALFALRASKQEPSEQEILLALEQGSRRKGFWHLPLSEKSQLGQNCRADALENPLLKTYYHITKHRVEYQIYRAKPSLEPQANERWHSVSVLESLPLTAPSRRAIEQILATDIVVS